LHRPGRDRPDGWLRQRADPSRLAGPPHVAVVISGFADFAYRPSIRVRED
jgi:hypothetical protein